MNIKTLKSIVLLTTCLFIFSCSKDDEEPVNKAPIIAGQTLNASESTAAGASLGTITATDPESNALSFNIKTNDNGLFAITSAGQLSIAPAKNLDFETATSHTITVAVSDGDLSAQADVVITVIDVNENTGPAVTTSTFDAAENIADSVIIGTVQAEDAQDDPMSFSISLNPSNLFEINASGQISLADGKSLDYEAVTGYTLEVSVSDSELTTTAEIYIEVTDVNEAPTASASTFGAAEDIADSVIIGTVVATDPEGDGLTFSLSVNPSNLFEINASGQISLDDGKSLDYETSTTHSLTVQVSDGNASTPVSITIDVTDVDEGATIAFEMVWKTTFAGDVITIPTNPTLPAGSYDYSVDWGDTISSDNVTGSVNHTYANPGTYTVSITGRFPAIYFNKQGDDLTKIKEIKQWGNMKWQTMNKAFRFCSQMNVTANDVPDLSQVTDMSFMFDNAAMLTSSLNNWNVDNVTNMAYLFAGATRFNQPLDNWDVSNVTSMAEMFLFAYQFNQDISGWNVGNVTNMYQMFYNATDFSQDLSGWDTANVTNCSGFPNGSGLTPAQLPVLSHCN